MLSHFNSSNKLNFIPKRLIKLVSCDRKILKPKVVLNNKKDINDW